MPQNNHHTSGSDPSQHLPHTPTDWSDNGSDNGSDTESSTGSYGHKRTILGEISLLLKQSIEIWGKCHRIILSYLLFNTVLVCITQNPTAPLIFAGILLILSSLLLYKFQNRVGRPSLKNFIAISIILSPFILQPCILLVPMISTPLVNLGALSAWAFIGISALICYSYKKFNTPKQASVDRDTPENEWSSCRSDHAPSLSFSSSTLSPFTTKNTEDPAQDTQERTLTEI